MLTSCRHQVTNIVKSARCLGFKTFSKYSRTNASHSILFQRNIARTLHSCSTQRELHASALSTAHTSHAEVDVSLQEDVPGPASVTPEPALGTTQVPGTPSVQYSPASPSSSKYLIPPLILEQAIAAKEYWQWNLFRHIETNERPTRHYCKTKAQAEEVAQLFLQDGYEHLGFDLEWDSKAPKHSDPGMKAKSDCSMLQLANEKRIAIFHLALHNEATPAAIFPPTLAHILSSPTFTKLGIHIRGDMTRLSRCYLHDTPPRAVFELSHLYKVTAFRDQPSLINRKSVAMADLVEKVWGLEMFKDENVRGSDWSKPCGLRQIEYAASDAYAGLQLFHELDKTRRACVPEVAMPAYAEFKRPLVEKGRMSRVSKTPITASELEEDQEEDHVDDVDTVVDTALRLSNANVEDRVQEIAESRRSTKPSRERKQQNHSKDERSPAEKAAALERRRVFLQAKFQGKSKGW